MASAIKSIIVAILALVDSPFRRRGRTGCGSAIELVDHVSSRATRTTFRCQTRQARIREQDRRTFARKFGKSVGYTFYPDATGFIRNTLNYRRDVVLGTAQGDDLVQPTNPYYRRATPLRITKMVP
jgi:hypothetical protein